MNEDEAMSVHYGGARAEDRCPGYDGDRCDGTLLHNSFTDESECASAYLALYDDGVLDGTLLVDESDLTDDQRVYLAHWREHRVPDHADG